MWKYSDQPMDLADAALVRVAEREGIRKIFTVDKRDFGVYRLHGRTRPTLLPDPLALVPVQESNRPDPSGRSLSSSRVPGDQWQGPGASSP
jgi:hypothetical protein